MNSTSKLKVTIVACGYANNSIAIIVNGLVYNTSAAIISIISAEFSLTGIKVTLVVFDHDLSKKSIMIVDYAAVIYLPIGDVSAHLDESTLFQV